MGQPGFQNHQSSSHTLQCLYATPVPAFELWTFPNYTDTIDRKVSNDNIYIYIYKGAKQRMKED